MLLKTLRILGLNLVEILRTRVEILSLDVQESRMRLVSILLLGAFSFLLLGLGIILGLFFLILTFWESDRMLVVEILTISLLGVGVILLITMIVRLKSGPRLFNGTMEELEKDRIALGGRPKRNT